MKFKISKICVSTFIIGSVIFSFIFYKAFIISFTHDESFSYLRIVHTGFMDIISYKYFYTNNHILNTLFMKYSEKLLGSSEIALRLPNLILLVVYMSYSYALFKRTGTVLCIVIFAILCSNNPLIDLFGLARGYGLSCGFMLMSIYHFIQSFYSQKTKNIVLFHIGSLLGILSSFTILDVYVSLLLIYNVIIFIDTKIISKTKYNFLSSNKVHAIPFLIVTGVLYEPMRRLITCNNIDFGGKTGLFHDTVTQIIYYLFYEMPLATGVTALLKIIFTGIVLISFIIFIRKVFTGNATFFKQYKGLIISNLLVISIFSAIKLQHIIFKIDFPVSRFSIFILPVFVIHFGYFLFYFANNGYKKGVMIISICLALASLINFGMNSNLNTCFEWSYDLETKNMVQKLTDYHDKNSKDSKPIRLGITWAYEPTINFYRETMNLSWLIPVTRDGITKDDDYYYINKSEWSNLNPDECEVIFDFDKTNSILLKNKKNQ